MAKKKASAKKKAPAKKSAAVKRKASAKKKAAASAMVKRKPNAAFMKPLSIGFATTRLREPVGRLTTLRYDNRIAEELFENYVVKTAAKKGIDATQGSGPEIILLLTNELKNRRLTVAEMSLLKSNLIKLTNQMIEDLNILYPNDMTRFHEGSLGNALRKLCPIFPFCKKKYS
jgi:hypothetical protein